MVWSSLYDAEDAQAVWAMYEPRCVPCLSHPTFNEVGDIAAGDEPRSDACHYFGSTVIAETLADQKTHVVVL
jgi:hypothetical protein